MAQHKALSKSAVAVVRRSLMVAGGILVADPRTAAMGHAAKAVARRFSHGRGNNRRVAVMALVALAQQAHGLRH